MKSRKRKKKRMIKRAIVSLCAVFLIFSLIYYLIGKLKEFAVENVAKSAVSEQVQIKTSKNSVKQSTAKKSEVGELIKPKQNGQKTNLQEQQNKNNQSNNKQQINQDQKVVYLTFDDGPSALTNQILDVLNREKIHATFFMIGKNLYDHQQAVKRAVQEGNYIGAHSMTHNYNRLYKQGFFVSEMEQTLSIINHLTGENTRLVRAPYGSRPGLSLKLRHDSANAGLKIWDWNVDTHDWENTANASTVINEVKKQATKNNEVILLHEKQATLDALPEIISYLRAKGYAFKVYNQNEHFSLNFWNDRRL
ncbi:polysaccharide deacetylase family protein [Gottfriedia solisilvae]|uniref:Polysaccharide deacetylase n=1 Tax=Gottfriedia solisilvae TaxID=1516104 RepID=A0A8J3AE25_9BACI|nr:polysaccharide deacetylase family protein [Gottfriedia solisilvae]GGI12627.1 polysaccharide deacetylase [Gottfriedia solisilvae]